MFYIHVHVHSGEPVLTLVHVKVLSSDTVQGVVGDHDLGGICDCMKLMGF